MKPSSKLTLVSALQWFEKAESAEPVYNVASAPFLNLDAPGTSDKNIGTEIDIIATYHATKNVQLQAGYSWFFYGHAVSNFAAINRSDAYFF